MNEHENRHLEAHPHASIFPSLSQEDYDDLKQDIESVGLIDPIVLYDGQVLDGRHRYKACLELGIDPRFDVLHLDTDTLRYVISKNVKRRHLSISQKALMAAEMVNTERGGDRKSEEYKINSPIGELIDRDRAAALFAVGARSVDRALYLLRHGDDELIQRVRVGDQRLSNAEQEIKALRLDEAEEIVQSGVSQSAVVEYVDQGMAIEESVQIAALPEDQQEPVAAVIKQVKEEGKKIDIPDAVKVAKLPQERQERVIEIATDEDRDIKASLYRERRENRYQEVIDPGKIPIGEYQILLADPPWEYPDGGVTASYEAADQYRCMPIDDICRLGDQVQDAVSEDAALYLWTTTTHLMQARDVIEAWGFRYHGFAVWVKERAGMGSRWHNQCEMILTCVRGSFPPPPLDTLCSNVIHAPVTRHSKKPDALYEILESQYPDAAKLEMFARDARPGWDVWGNQSGG